jgi:excisionase family DNA binding protein
MIELKNDLLSGAAAAAAYIGVDRRSVYRMAEQGLLPVTRKGRRLFFRKSELNVAFASYAEAA